MLPRLADPELYRIAAERVRRRQLRTGDLRPLSQGGASLPALDAQLPRLAQQLARHVSTEHYAFSAVTRRRARVEGRERVLHVATPLDDIVLSVLAQVLSELLDPCISPRVFSYRRGRSAANAIHDLRAYLAAHARTRPDPRTRGLYVLRRDIRGYGEGLAVGADSALWPLLAAGLESANITPTAQRMQWLQAAFRPVVLGDAGLIEDPVSSVPTGSPLQPLACNLYLTALDRICEQVPAAFYARYGDDMLFAHADSDVALATSARMDSCVAALGLEWSDSKSAAYYFTQPGRVSEQDPFTGMAAIDYLGMRVDFRGAISLKRDKLRRLLGEVQQRLERSDSLLTDCDPASRIATLGAVVQSTLDPAHPLAHDTAALLRWQVDDRGQLRDLDYKIARLLAQTITGWHDVRALRSFPPRKLREQARLHSLTRERHRAGWQRP